MREIVEEAGGAPKTTTLKGREELVAAHASPVRPAALTRAMAKADATAGYTVVDGEKIFLPRRPYQHPHGPVSRALKETIDPFIDHLQTLYQRVNSDEKQLEIVFVSADTSHDGFVETVGKTPWLFIPLRDLALPSSAVPPARTERREKIEAVFPCRGFPTVGVLALAQAGNMDSATVCAEDAWGLLDGAHMDSWLSTARDLSS